MSFPNSHNKYMTSDDDHKSLTIRIMEDQRYYELLISILNSQLKNYYKFWDKKISIDQNRLFTLIEEHFIGIFHSLIRRTHLYLDKKHKKKVLKIYILKLAKNLSNISYFKSNKILIKYHGKLIYNMLKKAYVLDNEQKGEDIITDFSINITQHILFMLKYLLDERKKIMNNIIEEIIKNLFDVDLYVNTDILNIIYLFL